VDVTNPTKTSHESVNSSVNIRAPGAPRLIISGIVTIIASVLILWPDESREFIDVNMAVAILINRSKKRGDRAIVHCVLRDPTAFSQRIPKLREIEQARIVTIECVEELGRILAGHSVGQRSELSAGFGARCLHFKLLLLLEGHVGV
jgi:hypothetical protein